MKKIYVIGLGPGAFEKMTFEAKKALDECEIIVGYTVYVDLVKEFFGDKEFLTTPMTQEIERCKLSFEKANEGKTVAMICSGDAGVYGMSGLILELGKDFPEVEVEVIAGVSAVLSGAALLGAPLIHDFAVISLSDLLTPWEKIERRLRLSSKADFVICIYTPSSKKRHDYLEKACDIMLEHKEGSTPCGIVRNIGREGEEVKVLNLSELRTAKTDMFTTVFVGNSETKIIGDKLVTPRGYKVQ